MTKTMRATAMAVLLSFSSSFIVAPAHAAIVSTEEAVAMHQQDRSELKQFFDREDIARSLPPTLRTHPQVPALLVYYLLSSLFCW
jgi:hypothetical protein